MSSEPYQSISIHDGCGVATPNLKDAYNQLHELFEQHVGCPCIITGYEPKTKNKYLKKWFTQK